MKKWIAAMSIVALASGLSAQVKQPAKAPAKPAPSSTAGARPSSAAPSAPQASKPKPTSPTRAARRAERAERAAAKPGRRAARREKKSAVKPQAASPKASADKEKKLLAHGPHERDPFTSPIIERHISAAPCSGGVRCVASGELRLQGIVHMGDGDVAMIDNGRGKVYFLRVNDPVLNGVVTRITPNSIVIRERVIDQWGKPKIVEVVRRLEAVE